MRAGKDLAWLRPDGEEMTDAEWNDPGNHVLGMLIRGEATDEVDERGRRLLGEAILLLVNGGARTKPFTLPVLDGGAWVELHQHRAPVAPGRPAERGEPHGALAHAAALRGAALSRCPSSVPPTGCSSTPAFRCPGSASSSPT